MTSTTSGSPTLVVSRVFDAPRELVWKVWTEEKHVTQWWGPACFTAPHITIDLRPGGEFQFAMRAPDGAEHWVKGVYHEIDAPNRLVTTMWFCDPQGRRIDPVAMGFPDFVPKEFH